ncbi:sugar O-acetyltransferase [Streptomyces sp. HNM0574]|uniref:sugar O-acetyltransferase n=1 Tax=Streptomyces sp. HNM0574 TaxID=2714954 RepID=UPI00146DA7C9|nr:sugar O-acetyltransferase [Streptomyces sp. HNM0574]NLU70572.1 sugar O-acetyltransferase [Streptomyces sp. HNM0574]
MSPTNPAETELDRIKARLSSGELYSATDPELTPYRLRCMDLLDKFNSTGMTDFAARETLLGDLVGRVGPGGWVMPRFLCEFGFFIELGAGTKVNFDVTMLDCAPIVIGEDVLIAPHCRLYTANHPFDPGLRRDMWEIAAPVTVGDRVWLGGGVTVLPGVSIGAETVVGAGSVVTKDLPPKVLAVGNPARVIREL